MGVAPSIETTSAVAKKVKSGTKQASPAFKSHVFKANVNASVPFAQLIQCFTPTYSYPPEYCRISPTQKLKRMQMEPTISITVILMKQKIYPVIR